MLLNSTCIDLYELHNCIYNKFYLISKYILNLFSLLKFIQLITELIKN